VRRARKYSGKFYPLAIRPDISIRWRAPRNGQINFAPLTAKRVTAFVSRRANRARNEGENASLKPS
jgi:hypothetical protein